MDTSLEQISFLKIDPNQYKIIKMIGAGFFGSVYLAKDLATGKHCALKQIQCQIMNPSHQEYLNREIKIMAQISHPALIQLKGFSSPYDSFEIYDTNATIIMDYISNGSLFKILQLARNNSEMPYWNATTKNKILIGIASGMKYLHSKNIIHRDLKSANILLDENYEPRITDFGLSKIISSQQGSSSPMNTTNIGTPLYMAPEIILKNTYSFEVDVYAFGLIAYEVITGLPLYPGVKNPVELATRVCNGERLPIPSNVPHDFRNLISRCWAQDPKQRPTFDEIHKFLTDPGKVLPGADRSQLEMYIRKVSEDRSMNQLSLIENQLQRQKKQMQDLNRSLREMVETSARSSQTLKRNLETVKREKELVESEIRKAFQRNEELIEKISMQNKKIREEIKQLNQCENASYADQSMFNDRTDLVPKKRQNFQKMSSKSLIPLKVKFILPFDQINNEATKHHNEKDDEKKIINVEKDSYVEENNENDDFFTCFEHLDDLDEYYQNIFFDNEENSSYNCFDKSTGNWFCETYPPNDKLNPKIKKCRNQKDHEIKNTVTPGSPKKNRFHFPRRFSKLNFHAEIIA